mmetsp:Transcript_14299/g.35578  ORF Transcript_14299/g.35578 Transcript_14299/m.35578 type:complete len:221 (-) Transcript_14299:1178-1840(-)
MTTAGAVQKHLAEVARKQRVEALFHLRRRGLCSASVELELGLEAIDLAFVGQGLVLLLGAEQVQFATQPGTAPLLVRVLPPHFFHFSFQAVYFLLLLRHFQSPILALAVVFQLQSRCLHAPLFLDFLAGGSLLLLDRNHLVPFSVLHPPLQFVPNCATLHLPLPLHVRDFFHAQPLHFSDPAIAIRLQRLHFRHSALLRRFQLPPVALLARLEFLLLFPF